MKKNINLIIKKLIQDISNIENNKHITQKFKNILYKKKSILFKKNIKKLNISLNSYIAYISRARKQFINKKHHNFKKKIIFLKKNFLYFKKEIHEIYKNKDTYNIYVKIKSLKNKLHHIYLLSDNIKKIKINNKKKKNIKIINKTITLLPTWKKELKNLIQQNLYKSSNIIINKIQEGKKILKKIEKIKISHEITNYLKVEKKKFELAKYQSFKKLKKKKNYSINIDYVKYVNKINYIILKTTSINNIKELALLSFSLSAITGRRMIEIIRTGKFYKTNYQHIVKFSGQAKTKIKKKYNIYILWYNSDFLIKKIKQIRKSKILKNIFNKIKKNKNIYISVNNQLNNYLSNPFNRWVKNFVFQNHNHTYKDSRSIYARIAFQIWYKKDKKWKNKDEDIFFYKILGHKNLNTQIYYKQFKLKNFSALYIPKKKIKNIRLLNLIRLDKKIKKILKRKNTTKIHIVTKKIIQNNPDTLINNYILRKFNFNTKLIQKYIKFISKYIYQKKIKGRYKIISTKWII